RQPQTRLSMSSPMHSRAQCQSLCSQKELSSSDGHCSRECIGELMLSDQQLPSEHIAEFLDSPVFAPLPRCLHAMLVQDYVSDFMRDGEALPWRQIGENFAALAGENDLPSAVLMFQDAMCLPSNLRCTGKGHAQITEEFDQGQRSSAVPKTSGF